MSVTLDMDEVSAAWWDQAACRAEGVDPNIFWPTPGSSIRVAKQICKSCPIRDKCLDWAVTHFEFGIWGGTSERERKRMRR